MPIPASFTRTATRRSSSGASSTCTWTSPFEYLIALSTRFETAAFNSSGSPRTVACAGSRDAVNVGQRLVGQVMPNAREVEALADGVAQIDRHLVQHPRSRAGTAGAKHLFDQVEQAIAVGEHHTVELAALVFGQLAPLQGFEVEADRGDRRLQLMRHRVDERIVLLVPARFAHKEDGVHHDAREDHQKQDDPEDEQQPFAPVEDDPADVQRDDQAIRQVPSVAKTSDFRLGAEIMRLGCHRTRRRRT